MPPVRGTCLRDCAASPDAGDFWPQSQKSPKRLLGNVVSKTEHRRVSRFSLPLVVKTGTLPRNRLASSAAPQGCLFRQPLTLLAGRHWRRAALRRFPARSAPWRLWERFPREAIAAARGPKCGIVSAPWLRCRAAQKCRRSSFYRSPDCGSNTMQRGSYLQPKRLNPRDREEKTANKERATTRGRKL